MAKFKIHILMKIFIYTIIISIGSMIYTNLIKFKSDNRFNIKNNSLKTIYFHTYINNNADTSLIDFDFKAENRMISAGKTTSEVSRMPWEYLFKSKKDTMYVYVFDANTIDSIGYEKVRKDYIALKRYKVTLKDIQTKPITIIYNGEIQNFKKSK